MLVFVQDVSEYPLFCEHWRHERDDSQNRLCACMLSLEGNFFAMLLKSFATSCSHQDPRGGGYSTLVWTGVCGSGLRTHTHL